MKSPILTILFFLVALTALAQPGNKFQAIDRRARATGFYPLKELAQKLTAPYKGEEEKVRSVFIWITAHIAYDIKQYQLQDTGRYRRYESLVDENITGAERGDLVMAYAALKDKMAVCAGYAALFKALCGEAGIRAAIVTGDARGFDALGQPYQSNHAWNAVMIRDEWKLMDATWASGYSNPERTKVTKKYNPHYYDTPPEVLILDHLPDSLKWTLLAAPPSRKNFTERPYIDPKQGSKVLSFAPLKGVLERKAGDSVVFRLELKEKPENMAIYESETDTWIDYDNASPEPEPALLPEQKRKAGKPLKMKKETTAKEDAAIDAIIAYANSVPDQPKEHAQPVVTPLSEEMEEEQPHTFTISGDTVRLVYQVKSKGSRRLLLYCDGKELLGYQVNGR